MTETYFDKEKFSQLLQKAMGNRKMSEYAHHSGVSLTYLSELIRELRDNPPMPPTIKKLAAKAYGGVTYEDLMTAAGHSNTTIYNEENIGEKVRDARVAKGVSPEELGNLTGLGVTYIYQVEHNEINPSLESLDRIAKALKIEDNILYDKGRYMSVRDLTDEDILWIEFKEDFKKMGYTPEQIKNMVNAIIKATQNK